MKEQILALMDNVHEAKEAIEINDMLGLTTVEEYQELQKCLDELVDSYIMFYTKKEKYILLKNCPGLKIGRLSLNKKGFGFVLLEKEPDLYIDKSNINGATHDDVVLCEVLSRAMQKEGRVIKVIKRDLKNLVGEIVVKHNKYYLDLDDDKKDFEILLDKESTYHCVEGQKVTVEIIKQVSSKKYIAKVIKVLGHKDDPGVDILSIAYKYGIQEDFGAEVEQELEDIPSEVSLSDLEGRTDLTGDMIFTIDGDDTKDIDDAISLTKENGLYHLGVHIADVSYYVKENTALGDAAFQRGTSNYLADTVIPMLPHQLSNGICSLNEGVTRLTISCTMDIDMSGKVISYDIFPSYIKSNKKMTYGKVNDILVRNIVDPEYVSFVDTLKNMEELAGILRSAKEKRGYIDFDLDEAKVIQDDEGHAIDIKKRTREVGEKLIEDFMIIANETVASHIFNMNLPFIYRVHEDPKAEKVEEFVTLVKLLGYHLTGKLTDLTPGSMQNILRQLTDKPEFKILSSLLLRSMRKAEYSKENLGHFGLASRAYTHFTSPIRRFPDLTVHRLLRTYLFEGNINNSTIDYYNNALVEIASHSSEREVASINAERDVFDMKVAEYMEGHIGEVYEGVITTVTNFGFFVELPNLVEGLVHVSTLKGDYYNYVPELLCMIGSSTKKQYRLGDTVRVKVVAASKETSMVDFELVGGKDGDQQ